MANGMVLKLFRSGCTNLS